MPLDQRTHSIAPQQATLTMRDHVGVHDEVMEERQHLNHLVLCLGLGQLACSEGLRDIGLEEAWVDGVHDLHTGSLRRARSH